MDPIIVHLTTGHLRDRPAIPRSALIRGFQGQLRCGVDDAIHAVEQLVVGGYIVVESRAEGDAVVRGGPKLALVLPTSAYGDHAPGTG